MTNEEALNICRLAKEAIAVKCDPNNDANDVKSMMRNMQDQIAENADLDFMLAAIEKQIPKKPETRKLTAVYREKLCECGEWLCSTADGKIIGGTESNYCRRCGQRLDWDEEAKK